MKACTIRFAVIVLSLALAVRAGARSTAPKISEGHLANASATAPQDAPAPAANQTTLPPQSAQPQGAAPLRVMVDKSLLINTTERLKRISVTDPSVAYATVITPTQILVLLNLRVRANYGCSIRRPLQTGWR